MPRTRPPVFPGIPPADGGLPSHDREVESHVQDADTPLLAFMQCQEINRPGRAARSAPTIPPPRLR